MEGVVVIAGVAASVWAAVLLFRGGLLGGALAVLVAGCCFGYPLFHVPIKPIPLTADRLLWVVLGVQYVVWRRVGWAEPKRLAAPDVVLGLLLVSLALSALGHDWQAHGALPLSRLVFSYVMPAGVYWAARQARVSEQATVAVLACLTALGAYLAITAVAEVMQANWLVFPRYIMSSEYPEFLGRARGPLLNPIGNGIYLGACLAAGLLLWPRLGRGARVALLPGLALMGVGVWLTLTRSVWLGAALGLVIVLGLALPREWRRWVVAGSLMAAALAAVMLGERLWSFKRDRALSAEQTAESARLRPILATVAWRMFLDRPLLGCGFGQYADASKDYLSDRSVELPLEKARPFVQHNTFLALLTETGLVGMGLLVALLALWVRDAWRLWRSPQAPSWARSQAILFLALAAGYVVNAMFHDVAIIPMVNMMLLLVAGMTAASARAFLDRPAAPQAGQRAVAPSGVCAT